MNIYNREVYIEEFSKIIISSQKLKSFYLETGSLNFYSRKLLIFLAEEVDFEEAVSCLTKAVKKTNGDTWGTLLDYQSALIKLSNNQHLVNKLIDECRKRID